MSATHQCFVDGFANRLGLDAEVLDMPGASIVSTADRAGSGIVACYRVRHHLVVWSDPAMEDRLEDARRCAYWPCPSSVAAVSALPRQARR